MQRYPLTFFTPRATLLAVAGLLAGATAGIAAISDNSESRASPQPALSRESPPAIDTATAAMQTEANVTAEAAATATEQASTANPQTGVQQIAPPKWPPALNTTAETPRTGTADSAEQYTMRIPFTNRTIKVSVRTFPDSPSEVGETAPSVVAYFEQKNGNMQLAGARGPVFPSSGGEDDWKASPNVVAHFERLETNRLAALKAQQAATAAAAAALAQPASPEASAAAPTAALDAAPRTQTPGG